MVHVFIIHAIVITKHNFVDHLKDSEKFLQKLVELGFKVKSEKSFFGHTETEDLDF